MTIIGLQAMMKIAVVTHSIPNKGLPLPFVSYAGFSLVMTLGAVGILWNIFRQGCARREDAGLAGR